MAKKKIAVIFGGRSPEHDVSVISGLQALQAIDTDRYEAFPVYISINGEWLVGDALHKRENYLPDETTRKGLRAVQPAITPTGRGVLNPVASGMFGGSKPIVFDVALPVFHGLIGEDGNLQGLFETAGIPYAGPRTMASALFMDKAATKRVARDLGIPVLPFALVHKGRRALDKDTLQGLLGGLSFPLIVKPNHLGSSIGVAATRTIEEVTDVLATIFRYDDAAIIEPCLQNFSEYNIAVMHRGGKPVTSAIEKPKKTDELLTFKQKYMSGSGGKTGQKAGAKVPGSSSEGMLSLTRELNPAVPGGLEQTVREYAEKMIGNVCPSGAPRIDFIYDEAAEKMFLNEINPCPGSLGFFLWEASRANPVNFVDLLTHLIEEALACRDSVVLPPDPVPQDARLLKR
ncbi:MAG: D-alanine--D-alanine ligase [Alphaproteobacteria bacterium]|nr:D-alanine--D-alanine ligase [Alphaproteobacteria bacterium]